MGLYPAPMLSVLYLSAVRSRSPWFIDIMYISPRGGYRPVSIGYTDDPMNLNLIRPIPTVHTDFLRIYARIGARVVRF